MLGDRIVTRLGYGAMRLPGKDVCVRSTVTGALFTFHFTTWEPGGGNPAAAYVRNAPIVGPVAFAGSTLPGPLETWLDEITRRPSVAAELELVRAMA